MGNLSELLDKVECQNGVELKTTNDLQPSQRAKQPSVLPSTPKKDERAEPAECLSGRWDERLFNAVNNDLSLPEVFKTLRSRILHPLVPGTAIKTILVTSAVPREGKSFVVANLGVSLAQGMDQNALLVDCDLRRPSLAGLFGMTESPGLVDYLRDNVELSELIGKTVVQKLSILASGEPPVNPAELLGSSRMSALVEELSCRYDDRIIIFDSPPMMVAAETSVLARQVDAVILVVREGVSRKAEIQKLIDKIGTEQIIGIVFNDHTTGVFESSYEKGYGYYHYLGTGKPL